MSWWMIATGLAALACAAGHAVAGWSMFLLFQWVPFAATAILAGAGALSAH
jgi:hypothetical protein